MNRCFISNEHECKGKCKYCFAKWNGYLKFPLISQFSDDTIIYPNCDGDFFDENYCKLIEDLTYLANKNVIISISTKFNISDNHLLELRDLNEKLKKENNGMLKISVSFSCIEGISNIEPGTILYQERINLIKRITQLEIPYVTLIKPLLPFVDISEYQKIVNDTISYCKYYVLGELYVQKDSNFFEEYIHGRNYVIENKDVSWNGENGKWYSIVDLEKERALIDYIKEKNGIAFTSDQDALMYMKNEYREKGV